jgi:hypothetical protein
VVHLTGVHNNHGSIVNCMHTGGDSVSPLICNWIEGLDGKKNLDVTQFIL